MFIFRLLGGWALIVALIALAADVSGYAATAGKFTSLGRHWFTLSPSTLNLVQAITERYVHPFVWDPVLTGILSWPTFVVFGVLGALLYLAGRKRKRADIFAN